MPLDKEQYTSTNPTSFPSISVDNGLLVGDTLSTQNITGKILYSGTGTTYIPVGISTVVANSVAYQATAPSNPSVGQIWVDSSSNNTNYDPNLIRRKTIVATGGQTAFTADLAFTDGYEQIFLNGLLLTRNTDYTTVNSIQVNLVVAAVVNDVIDILSITNLNAVGAAGALTTSNTFTGSQTFTPSSAAITPITVNGAFNQTADLLQIKKYDGTYGLNISNTGNIGIGGQAASALSPKVYIYNDTTGGVFQTVGNDTWFGWEMDSFQPNGKYAGIVMASGRGTSSSPAPAQSGDKLGFVRFNSFNTLNTTNQNAAAEIAVFATENHTASTGASAMAFYTSPTGQNYYAERMRISSSGKILIGKTTDDGYNILQTSTTFGLSGIAAYYSEINHNTYYNGGWKSQSGGPSSQIVMGGGTSFTSYINFLTDPNPIGTASGAASNITVRMQINANGNVGVGWTPDNNWHLSVNSTFNGAGAFLSTSSTNQIGGLFENTFATFTNNLVKSQVVKANNSNFIYYSALSSSTGTADTDWYVRGDGQVFTDGSTSMSSPADYAEYFEWADGNPNNEDRAGYSVSLTEGNMIKIASGNESVIGIVSGNPAVVGDAAWNMWTGKYQKDEFNRYVRDGEGYRILNPNYDPDSEYIPREDRKEWSTVGLVGKLRMYKGQKTDSRWIKMRDISDTIEEWLVR